MKKKILFLVAAFALFVPSVLAAELTASTDAELINAFATAADGDTIKLTADIENHQGGSSALMVKDGKSITLDLNGHNLSTDPAGTVTAPVNKSIVINNGTLTITGKGTITHQNHVAVNVWAAETSTDKAYSTLIVGKDVTLKGNTGISVFYGTKTESYGGVVELSGKIDATDLGVTVNGFIKNTTNRPVINIKSGAVVNATGEKSSALYGAGNAVWNIEAGTTITAKGSAIGAKSGTFNIKGGEFTATGKYNSNPELDPAGINPSGSAIQIETNPASYYGNVEMNIEDGTFTSVNGAALLEYGSDTDTAVNAIEISGGEFNSSTDVKDLVVSNGLLASQENKNTISISGGAFTDDITDEFISEDSITISLIAVMDNTTEKAVVLVVPTGIELDEQELIDSVNEELKLDNVKLTGIYLDKELKTKANLTTGITENTTLYMSFVKVESKGNDSTVKEENPKTSDINLALILASLGVASVGAVLISRKKLAKVNK